MIALLCSVSIEAGDILAAMKQMGTLDLGSKTIHHGSIAGHEVALCAGGMGKANAAHAAALLLTKFEPRVLIVFGIGGAYASSGARIGDLALASEEIAGDEGVLTPEGFKGTQYIGIPLVQTAQALVHNHFPATSTLLQRVHRGLSASRPSENVHTGKFVTLSTCTGTNERARELESRYGALCENMEGAAAAQVAVLHNVPWLEVRSISNIVEERDLKQWDIPRAAQEVQQAILTIVESWEP